MGQIKLASLFVVLFLGSARADKLELDRRIPVDVVLPSAAWGGLAGGAVGGALIGYQMGIQNQSSYNWAPVLATTVGIGLAAGALWGIIDGLMARRGPPMVNGPIHDGLAYQEQHPSDHSGRVTIPFMAGRF